MIWNPFKGREGGRDMSNETQNKPSFETAEILDLHAMDITKLAEITGLSESDIKKTKQRMEIALKNVTGPRKDGLTAERFNVLILDKLPNDRLNKLKESLKQREVEKDNLAGRVSETARSFMDEQEKALKQKQEEAQQKARAKNDTQGFVSPTAKKILEEQKNNKAA